MVSPLIWKLMAQSGAGPSRAFVGLRANEGATMTSLKKLQSEKLEDWGPRKENRLNSFLILRFGARGLGQFTPSTTSSRYPWSEETISPGSMKL